jgi:fagellar hook-basal body proteins
MTLSSAMNTAVSALKAQGQALSVISNNLSNSSTTGYKSVTTSFSSLVVQAFSGTSYNGAGVTSSARQNVDAQGSISATGNATDLAIDGNGMFVVSSNTGTLYFTRDGEFDTNDEGYLVNGNYTLMGWPTNADGTLVDTSMTASSLEKINVTSKVYSAKATSAVTVNASLGSATEVGSTTYTKTMEVYDSLGTAHTITMTFTHTAADTTNNTNTWTVGFSSDDGTTTLGDLTMTFDGDGALTSIEDSGGTALDPSAVTLPFSWSNAANDSSISLKLSNISMTGSTDGVTLTSTTNDGYATGKLTGVSVSADGTVTASYDNGQAVPIYKIAIATFPNYDGLQALSNTVYQVTSDSGSYTLNVAGQGAAGTISASALESSTVDTADEFTRMIVAQQAYSAASQVITTAKDMYDALISAVR